ncbi:MAG: HepT-like ribonuclease domain-containing protein [Nanoarchaeota archaeon]
MKRDYKLFIEDISRCIEQIELNLNGISEEQFRKSDALQSIVMMKLQIIGESSRNIPGSVKQVNPLMPWREMANVRDLISHSYYLIGADYLWRTVNNQIPRIKLALKNIKLV